MDKGRDHDIAGSVAEGVQACDFGEAAEEVMACLRKQGELAENQEIAAQRAIR